MVLEDRLLVWKFKRGDKCALSTIYVKYIDDLLRIAASLLKDRTEAHDVVHDVFIDFVNMQKQFKLTGSLKGYLMTCVANKARNVNRTMSRKQTVSFDSVEPVISGISSPDEMIVYDEQFQHLCDAMAELPYEQREAVVLHIHGELKFKAVAQIQQTTIQTTCSRYRYGIDKLRLLLNGQVKL